MLRERAIFRDEVILWLPFLSALSGSETGQKMNFSDNETDLILQVLMQRMSAEERSKIDMVRMLSRMIGQKK